MAGLALGRRDLDGVLEVVAEAAAARDSTPFPLPVVERLMCLVRCDRGGYFEYRLGVTPNTYAVEQPYVRFPQRDELDRNVWRSWSLPDDAGERADVAVLKVSDRLTRAARRRNPFHTLVSRPLGVEDEMKLWLPAPKRTVRGFFFCRARSSPDFGERERALLDLLAPHLARIRSRWDLDSGSAGVLTPRERELMRLVGRGLTNREIAADLHLSPGTVRSHLDHIYVKLGVHTRTAALAKLTSQVGLPEA